eukprot:TRINITY_DN7706_c0_g1_i3.p1 TRINITY_DN7706_c0_g1~~TRINITY_DN7706_c0_g1_i3.p1  ORF type:complete len:222 (+),score=43.60 TRINITY_DN7706_c0_g1_i3:19-684(+)
MSAAAAAAAARAEDRTFYDVLSIHPEATPSQIRQAYRKAALRWHPDKVHRDDKALAEKRFQEVAQANEVLSNGDQRRIYDLYLRCKPLGFLEIADPADPSEYVQIPVTDWAEFSRLFSNGALQSGPWPGEDASRYHEDADDTPISAIEWVLAGGVVIGLWSFLSWRHSSKVWLKEMPQPIYQTHTDFAMPLGLLIAPLFFGSVPWNEAVKFINSALSGVKL